jgi:aspartate aminotransferase
MSLLASQLGDYLQKSSWIRRMFEKGAELKQQHGEDRVYDFSLGNPDLPPPASVGHGLREIAASSGQRYAFGYMPNGGYPTVREQLAGWVSREQGIEAGAGDVMLTCGAAGGLNALFRALLEPGEEVVCPAPYFVEYFFYADNHGGRLKPVPAKPPDFRLDLEALERAITERTGIVLLNSPNNPTGQVYDRQELQGVADILRRVSRKRSRPVFLVSDEPYRFLTFDGCEVPSILPLYEQSVVVSSFSKNLSLAGERIGYVLLNPDMQGKQELMDGLVFTNRILGFVNAPAVGQRLLQYTLGTEVDTSVFERRRELMQRTLREAGYDFEPPKGGFYFFPRAPGGDDVAFVQALQDERALAVPGSGFGFGGYIRMSFCVQEQVIENAAESLARARQRFE